MIDPMLFPVAPPMIPQARMGVIICRCGGKMEEALDPYLLSERVRACSNASYVAVEAFPCGKGGQERIHRAIQSEGLDRVVVAGCAPRLVGALFQRLAVRSGLDEAYIQAIDIRESCLIPEPGGPAVVADLAARKISIEMARLGRAKPVEPLTYPIRPSALVAGGNLAGLVTATSLANAGLPVYLIEAASALGQAGMPSQSMAALAALVEAVKHHGRITSLTNAHLDGLSGRPGDYRVQIRQGNRVIEEQVGAVVVALDAHPRPFHSNQWVDRERVRTQVEFAIELETVPLVPALIPPRHIVFLLSFTEAERGGSARVYSRTALRQAIRARELWPGAQVTLLYQDLELGEKFGEGENELMQARATGVSLLRYQPARPPVIREKTVDVFDPHTGEERALAYDRAVVVAPFDREPEADRLATILGIPQDAQGFLIDPRRRLRPGRVTDDGIYLLGGAHKPQVEDEILLQAATVTARVKRFLRQGAFQVKIATARVDANRCTGCGDCTRACPESAIRLVPRESVLSLSQVEPTRCTGCGACVVACPVRAMGLPGWEDDSLLAQIEASLQAPVGIAQRQPRIIVFGCEWSGQAAAELAGVRGVSYPGNLSMIRLNCSARFDPYHALWALLNGADGVLMLACPPGECHYGHGNRLARNRMAALQQQMQEYGIDPSCVRLEFIQGDDIEKFTQVVADFVSALQKQPAGMAL